MTARLTIIPGGKRRLTDDHEVVDTFDLRQALVGIEHTRPPNLRIRKQLMLEALQKASIAIYRNEFDRADAILEQTRTSIRNTIKRLE